MGNKDSTQQKYTEEANLRNNLYEVPPNQMDSPIHRYLGALTFKLKDDPQLGKGTGILISPNLVLTVAHNIFHHASKQFFYDLKFYYRQCGILQRCYQVDRYFFPEEFKINNNTENDFAILKLKDKIYEEHFIPLYSGEQSVTNEAQISIFGYPNILHNYKPLDRRIRTFQVFQFGQTKTGRIKEVIKEKKQIFHTFQTEKGSSGSPLILEDSNEKLRIIGIHKGKCHRNIEGQSVTLNSARLVTPQMILLLKRKAQEMGAIPFMETEQYEKAQVYFDRGQLAYREENWHLAIDHYLKAIELDSKFKEAHNNLGKALKNIGKLQSARGSYYRAIEIDSNYKQAYYNLGNILFESGDPKGAMENYKNAIKIDPKYKEAYYNLGNTQKKSGDLKNAKKNYLKAIDLDPSQKDAYNNLGNILFRTGDLKGAMKNYCKAIEIDPNFKKAYSNVFVLIEENGSADDVIKFLQRQISKHPHNNIAKQYIQKIRDFKG